MRLRAGAAECAAGVGAATAVPDMGIMRRRGRFLAGRGLVGVAFFVVEDVGEAGVLGVFGAWAGFSGWRGTGGLLRSFWKLGFRGVFLGWGLWQVGGDGQT